MGQYRELATIQNQWFHLLLYSVVAGLLCVLAGTFFYNELGDYALTVTAGAGLPWGLAFYAYRRYEFWDRRLRASIDQEIESMKRACDRLKGELGS